MEKVIYTINESRTAVRMETCKDESQKSVIRFIMSGKNYDNWAFMDIVEKKDRGRGWTGGDLPHLLIVSNSKIFVDQICSNETIEEFAAKHLKKLNTSEVFVFNLKECPSWDIPKFEISSYTECGDINAWTYVTSTSNY